MKMSEEEMAGISPDILILDEFHRAGAEMWSAGIERLWAIYPLIPVLALFATAARYLDDQRDMPNELFEGYVASEMTLGKAIVQGILPAPKYVTTVFRYQNELTRLQGQVTAQRRSSSTRMVCILENGSGPSVLSVPGRKRAR